MYIHMHASTVNGELYAIILSLKHYTLKYIYFS